MTLHRSPNQRVLRWGLWPSPFERRPPLAWPRDLLVAGHGGLGDTVVSLPVLYSIRRAAPRTKITWMAPSAFEPLLARAGVDAFIATDLPPARPLDVSRFGALLAFQDADASAYAHLGPIAEIPLRIGSANGRLQRRWCNHLVYAKRLGWPRHEAQRNLRLLLPFGVDVSQPLLSLSRMVALPAFEQPVPQDLPQRNYIVLHPFSAGSAREWPIVHWARLATTLCSAGWSVVLTGSPKEAQRLADQWPTRERPVGVCEAFGRLDLGQLGALLSGASGLVAASTGPLHLAAALGIPSLGLFVPRKGINLSRWAPLGARAEGMQARAHCRRHCNAESCRCIRDLSPAAVAARIELVVRIAADSDHDNRPP